MISVDKYCKNEFGHKLYKLSFDGGFTCPNRDGKIDSRGCIFCSAGGSGDFAVSFDPDNPSESFEKAKAKISGKYKGDHYIAYFQAFSNTYGDIEYMRKLYFSVIENPEVYALSIATRPDCLDENVYTLLKELNEVKPVWVELGLQTSKEETAKYIRRGYGNAVYRDAVKRLNEIGIHTITHLILFLPGEDKGDMLSSLKYALDCGTKGVKIQVLQVLKGTDLAKDFENGLFKVPTFEEYLETLRECIDILPKDIVVHRLTGDPPRRLLIEPKWTLDKKKVLNAVKDITEPYSPYFVYIIECADGTLYTGSAKDVEARFEKHKSGAGAKYTKAHVPEKIVYVEELRSKRKALQREYEIKQLSRAQKLELIKNTNG